MTSRKPFFLFLFTIPVLALAAGVCNAAGIKTHLYLWELLLDAKTILLVLLYLFLIRPGAWKTEARERGVFRWGFLRTAGAFFIPAVIAGATLGAGLLFKKASFADPENAATVLLTLIFDIPAVFIFSATTVFVEEYIFRGFLLSEFVTRDAPGAGLAVSSVLWALYAIVEELPLDEFSWLSAGLLLLFYISVGVGASALYTVSRSLWVSYAFRIGVLTITPVVLSGVTGMTDAFFTTENMVYFGDGILASAITFVVFTIVFFAVLKNRRKAPNSVPA